MGITYVFRVRDVTWCPVPLMPTNPALSSWKAALLAVVTQSSVCCFGSSSLYQGVVTFPRCRAVFHAVDGNDLSFIQVEHVALSLEASCSAYG